MLNVVMTNYDNLKKLVSLVSKFSRNIILNFTKDGLSGEMIVFGGCMYIKYKFNLNSFREYEIDKDYKLFFDTDALLSILKNCDGEFIKIVYDSGIMNVKSEKNGTLLEFGLKEVEKVEDLEAPSEIGDIFSNPSLDFEIDASLFKSKISALKSLKIDNIRFVWQPTGLKLVSDESKKVFTTFNIFFSKDKIKFNRILNGSATYVVSQLDALIDICDGNVNIIIKDKDMPIIIKNVGKDYEYMLITTPIMGSGEIEA